MTEETSTAAAAATATSTATVPAHIIPAALPHPNISAPLARGIRYLHHFEIELVSDGARLWDAASAEGKQVLADIKRGQSAAVDAAAAAKAAPSMAAAINEAGATTDPANPGNADGNAIDPNAKPAA